MANRGTINKTYEREMQIGHIKEAKPQPPRATSNNTSSNMPKKQVSTASLTRPYQDEGIDMQLR
jgi:hypothetical protein